METRADQVVQCVQGLHRGIQSLVVSQGIMHAVHCSSLLFIVYVNATLLDLAHQLFHSIRARHTTRFTGRGSQSMRKYERGLIRFPSIGLHKEIC